MINLTPTALTVPPRKVLLVLAIVSVALGGASLFGQYLRFFHGIHPSKFENWDLEEEANFPTYYSSMLLLAAAFLLAVIARFSRFSGDRMSTRWRVLAVIFVALSIDEVVGIHEESGRLVPDGIDVLGGALYYGWVIPAGIVVATVGLYFVPFVRDLPDPHRARFIASAALYVGGALGVELAEGVVAIRTGDETWRFQLVATVQELSEMMGLSLFIWTLLKFIESREPSLRATVQVGDNN